MAHKNAVSGDEMDTGGWSDIDGLYIADMIMELV